jgi:hypothetical protein
MGIADVVGTVALICARPADRSFGSAVTASATVPQASHSPHRPAHLALRHPHCVHSNWTAAAVLAMQARYPAVLTL